MSERYIRQELLSEIGREGQAKLAQAKVCIVGCGGLGSIVAPYLAGAGIGELTLIDGDKPELSNLHRQVFFTLKSKDTKAEALAAHISKFNPEVKLKICSEMLSKANIDTYLAHTDLVIECTDEVLCKYLVNDWCHLHRKPLVYGAIHKFEGYVSLFENVSEESIQLRDAFPVPDTTIPSCSEVGVMNTIAGLIGILQANEALKYLLGLETIVGQLLTYDCLSNEQLKLRLKKAWRGKIKDTYENETYLRKNCAVSREVDTESLLAEHDKYNVISILEKGEHRDIAEGNAHVPLSSFIIEEWASYLSDKTKPSLFYCRMGRRSSILVDEIRKAFPEAEVYSLRGGLTAYKEES